MENIPSGEDPVSYAAKSALKILQKRLQALKKYTLLDIGCGNGRDIAFFSSNLNNIAMHGIDISKQAIKSAIKRNSNKTELRFDCIDWKELSDDEYDIIYSSGVYHFFNITNRSLFISKIKKILKPNGFFLMTTLSSNDKQYYGKGNPVKNDPNSFQSQFFIHFSSEEELREDFGFLKILDLHEYFHKNYVNDTKYHTMWMLIGENSNFK